MRRFLLTGLFATWWLIALFVLGVGYSGGGGIDGPCLGTTEWIGGSPEGTVIHGQTRLAPPGERCVAVGPRGFHAEQVFPGTGTWEAALLLALAPFAVWPVLRRMAAEVQVNRLSAG